MLDATRSKAETSGMKSTSATSLKHHFLIAMPSMVDGSFAKSLVYVMDHGPDGAMGLIVNKSQNLSLADLLEQLRPAQPGSALCGSIPVFRGGPVENAHGYVLHPADRQFLATTELGPLNLSTSQDILFSIADGHGPDRYLIALGYAGWGPGQLEAELADNAWLTCPANEDIIFDLPCDQRLNAAASSLGIDLRLLSTQAGHA